jgi:hypothetical protein
MPNQQRRQSTGNVLPRPYRGAQPAQFGVAVLQLKVRGYLPPPHSAFKILGAAWASLSGVAGSYRVARLKCQRTKDLLSRCNHCCCLIALARSSLGSDALHRRIGVVSAVGPCDRCMMRLEAGLAMCNARSSKLAAQPTTG